MNTIQPPVGAARATRRQVGLLLGSCLALAGCGLPRDPDDTLARIDAEHTMVVGVAPAPPQVTVVDGRPTGPEADLATGFAASRGATVRWVVGGLEALVDDLEHGELDLLVGGLTSSTPFASKMGLTRAYAVETDDRGKKVKRVVAAPLGENALVTALERWFDAGRP